MYFLNSKKLKNVIEIRNKPIKNVKYKTVTTHKMCRVNSIFINNFKADLSPLVLLTFWARCLLLLGAALKGYSAVPQPQSIRCHQHSTPLQVITIKKVCS